MYSIVMAIFKDNALVGEGRREAAFLGEVPVMAEDAAHDAVQQAEKAAGLDREARDGGGESQEVRT